jgi:glycosyltransferase involved in cell wall biosynthesis
VTTSPVLELACGEEWDAAELSRRLDVLAGDERAGLVVLVRSRSVVVPPDAAARLAEACAGPLVASASAVPSAAAPSDAVAVVPQHAASPPPPTLLLPSTEVCALRADALRSLGGRAPIDGTWRDALAGLARHLTDAGWRHVVAGGVAHRWQPDRAPAAEDAAWGRATVAAVAAAHAGLDAHRLWADTRLRPVRVVIDGQCVSDDIHNGTQVVVLNIARWLARTRPDAEITLAVPSQHTQVAERLLAGDHVTVVPRRSGDPFDLAYRPYQSIDPNDLRWFADAAPRTLLGQLDMIGYSNPSYHPSPALFHTVRNLQRHMLRAADGVTFISDFGRTTAVAECPDLASHRLHVVGCGVDVVPEAPDAATGAPSELGHVGPFVACLSATFRHKNRGHAIRTFAELCERHGYAGSLVIAGPEPYYGRSTDGDRAVIDALPADVARRVHAIGHVDVATKWWLLRAADLVLYPSVVEGFGLVPFEAANVGTPSLSHDGTGLHEVLGAPVALVAGWDPVEWADRAHHLISSPEATAGCVDAVLAAAGRQSWAEVARRTWTAIDTTLALPSVRHRDEGAVWSRVEPPPGAGVRAAGARHLVNRARAIAVRRVAPLVARVRRR